MIFHILLKSDQKTTLWVRRVGGGILSFVRDDLYSNKISIPCLAPFDQIMWASVRPKVLPCPFNSIVLCIFCYSPNPRSADKINFTEKLHSGADFVLSKYPNAGIFLIGDANNLKLESTCNLFNLEQIIKVPTTKVNTALDLICTNLLNFYRPSPLCPLQGVSTISAFSYFRWLK